MPVIKIIIIGILFCVDSVYVLIALFLVQWVLDPNSRQNCVVSKLSLKIFCVKCLLSRIDARNAALLTDTFEGERAPCMKVFLWQLPCCVTKVCPSCSRPLSTREIIHFPIERKINKQPWTENKYIFIWVYVYVATELLIPIVGHS